MKNIIAYILISVFVVCYVAEFIADFYKSSSYSVALDSDEDNEKKETEKQDIYKEKIFISSFFNLTSLKPTQKFYLEHLFFLPKPISLQDIIPPELV